MMQAPFKCASMLGHRLRVDRNKDSTHTHIHIPMEKRYEIKEVKLSFYDYLCKGHPLSFQTNSLHLKVCTASQGSRIVNFFIASSSSRRIIPLNDFRIKINFIINPF